MNTMTRPGTQARHRGSGSSWRRSLGYGLLWGCAITAGEMLSLPLGHLDIGLYLRAMASLFSCWGLIGIAIAWLAFAAEQRRLPLKLTATLLVVLAVILSSLQSARWLLYRYFDLPNAMTLALGVEFPSWTDFLYVLWMTLFHGALFNAGCLLAMRAEHTRHLLGEAQIARGKSEALLADAQLDTLRARVDPAFLLRAMGEIQRRYASEMPSADLLLNQLVSFLRLAMPGVRDGSSTLAAELGLAQSYAQLAAQIEPSQRWSFHLPGTTPDLPFPPLLLLPLLDALTPSGAGAAAGEVRLCSEPGVLNLTIHGADTTHLPPALAYRFQVALQTLFGNACDVRINPEARAGAPALTVRLMLPPAQAHHTAPAPVHASPLATKKARYA